MTTYSIFSQVLEPGKRTRVVPVGDFRLTTATFGEELKSEEGRTTIKVYQMAIPDDEDEDEDEDEDDEDEEGEGKEPTFEKEAVVIAHLLPGRIETQLLDLMFLEDEPVEFEITGKNMVHLVGNYIDQRPAGMPDGFGSDEEGDSEDDDEDGMDGEGYALEDVSSDVEIDPSAVMGLDIDSDDMAPAGMIEEVVEEVAVVTSKKDKSKKRARESDAMQVEEGEKESKKDKKKKQKAANGVAVATGETEKKAEEKAEKAEKKDKKDKETKTLPSGVTVVIHKKGTGAPVKKGQRVQMRYIGKLKNGDVFDKNVKGSPFSFQLGKGEVIKGWDEGIAGLSVGSEAVLTIPPAMAYGSKKSGTIPPNSTLTFEVKVLAAK